MDLGTGGLRCRLEGVEYICVKCHASVVEEDEMAACPACGGALIVAPGEGAGTEGPAPVVDHRGIVLPKRHAVGGVITPR